jgi:hypothetical protein
VPESTIGFALADTGGQGAGNGWGWGEQANGFQWRRI